MSFVNNKDKVGSSLVLLFSLIYLNVTFDIPTQQIMGNEVFTARTLPIGLSVMAIIVSLIQIFAPVNETENETISDAVAGFQWQPCLLLVGAMLLYGLTFQFLGFALSTFLFLFIGFSILKERRYLLSSVVAGGVAVFMWLVLTQLFDIYLDSGDLYHLLAGS
jgi:putative tricarboxylic transport membrane protein